MALSVPVAFALAACSSPMDKHPDVKLNPHPVQRYELTVVVDSPGPFDHVQARAVYEIANIGCTPKDEWLGVHNLPSGTRSFPLDRVSEHVYRGYFYTDGLKEEDYFGRGVCHWTLQSVGAELKVHGLTFASSLILADVLSGKEQVEYLSRRGYLDSAMNDDNEYSAFGLSQTPPFTSKFGDPFRISLKAMRSGP